MKARQITKHDLKVTKGWADAHDRVRTHVSLKGMSKISKTFWLRDEDAADLNTLDHVIAELQRLLDDHVEAVSSFIESPFQAEPETRERVMTPLFLPLKVKYFDLFKEGKKDTEYRLRGKRYNGDTCWIGRRVVLSRGYGKHQRLYGKIVGFHYDTLASRNEDFVACYGHNAGDAACIKIELDR